MKTRILTGLLLVLGLCSTRGAIYTESFTGVNATIPDGNPVGISFNGAVSDLPSGALVDTLSVSFTVSGGYNGDLYAYLVAPGGTKVTLLNQPGVTVDDPFGFGGSGFNVTLRDSAVTSIQTATEPAGVVFTGTYQAAGSLGDMDGAQANGTWTLFFADLSEGGGPATLNNWSLQIEPVPEPVHVALGVFGALFVSVNSLRLYLRKRAKQG